jgi:putative ABC transport system permease protein
VLFFVSALLGVGLARVLTHLAMRMLPPLPTSIAVPLVLDWRVMLFAFSLSIAAALVFGVLPAIRGADVKGIASLENGARGASGRSRLRSAFVVGQIMCSVLLVVLSASFVRVLRQAGAAEPGFDARGVEITTLDASLTAKDGRIAVWEAILDRVRRMPGVADASLARVPPGGWEGIGLGGVAPADLPDTSAMFSAGWNIVEPGYLATLGIPLLEGRDFASSDTAGAPPVVLVSQTLARRLWPGQRALGKSLRLPPVTSSDGRVEQRFATVTGVAGDIRSSSLVDGLAEPYVYLPLAQSGRMANADMTAQMSIVARRQGAMNLAAAIAAMIHDVDQRVVLARTESLADAIELGLTPQRVLATISGVMGVVALLLASMGIYGVTSYTVALRRREFAIRLALGAPPARIVRMVFRQGTWLVALGLGAGLGLAIGVGQVLSVFFYGLLAAHVPTLLGTAALFLVVGGAASVVPAGHAVREGWRRALQQD